MAYHAGSWEPQTPDESVRARLAEVFRLEHARVVASVLRIVRDIDAAQEVVQEAFEQALDHWPADGIPDRPGAWLLTTARRRALDHLRRVRRAGARVDALAHEALGAAHPAPDVPSFETPDEIPDDRLRLIFTCCHPALPADSRVALTLRLVGGLSTTEIARAFLVPEPTIAQRLVRAKRTIRDGGFPYEVPEGVELASRLSAVLAVLYLIFNEGYAAHSGDDLVRHDLCEEAIRLGRVLAELMPREPEVLGLLALMELQASRAAARTDADGNLVLLEDQDRLRWDRARIARGLACLERAGPLGARGRLPAPGRDRRLSRAGPIVGGDGLAAHRGPLSRARGAGPVPGHRPEPGGGDRSGRRARRPGSRRSIGSTTRRCAPIICCPPRAPSSSAVSAGRRRPPSSTGARSASWTTRASRRS